ncbi:MULTISPECIES: hypothetical protein [Paraclostridium]|uniref:hypothetical protein n=1 Tax=Paraclostridium TaxID=1849822 RepID=UPI00137927BD|nr:MULTISPECIES: hypothetical protein [Paraclostridium]
MDKKALIYIYNWEQSKFYIENGLVPIKPGVNERTGNIYMIFNREESQEVFSKWCTRNK